MLCLAVNNKFWMKLGPFVEGKGNSNLFWINSNGNILNDSFDIFFFWVMCFLTEKLAVPRIQEMTDMRSQHYEWSSCPLWTHTASMSTSSSSSPSSPRRRFNQKKLSSSSFVDEGSLRPKGQRSSLVPDTLMIAQLSTPQSTSVINCHLIMIQTHMKIQKTNTHIYLFYLFEPKYLKFKYHYFKIKIRLKATTIKQCIWGLLNSSFICDRCQQVSFSPDPLISFPHTLCSLLSAMLSPRVWLTPGIVPFSFPQTLPCSPIS